MALTPSLPTADANGLGVIPWRRISAGTVVRAADGTPRTGILPAHYGPLVTGKSSLGYTIGEFVAVTARAAGGVEFVANDGAVDLSPSGYFPPASGRRRDVIWVRSRFVNDGDTANTPELGIAVGEPHATAPAKPALPAGALELAVAEIKSTDTTTQTVVITQSGRFTAMSGGVVPLRNAEDQAAFVPADGVLAYRIDEGRHVLRRGGSWVGVQGFTPSWSGFTPGASQVSAWWQRNGEWIEGEVSVILGTGWNFGASPRLNPPVPMLSPVNAPVGSGTFVDSSAGGGIGYYYPAFLVRSGSRIAPLFLDTTTGRLLDLTNASPFAWTSLDTPDELHLQFRYRG